MVAPSSFDAFYYAHCCGKPYERTPEWLSEFGRLAERIVADIRPATTLDAGCAIGLLVETLRDRGVDAWGVDISSFAIDHVHESVRTYCTEGSIAEPFARHYDLITCIEVLEHMPTAEAERAIANLCAHTSDVLFSSSPFDYREPTHVNVHPPEHWAEMFARQGFVRDVDFDAAFITPWAARFRRSGEPLHRVVRALERQAWAARVAERDARAYATDVQAQLAHSEAEVADVRAAMEREVAMLRALCPPQDEIASLRAQLIHSQDEVADVRTAMDREVATLRALVATQEDAIHRQQAEITAHLANLAVLRRSIKGHAVAAMRAIRRALDRRPDGA